MSFDQKFQNRLLIDVISQNFDEADDLVQFVQSRTGKLDGSVITHISYAKSTCLKIKLHLQST